METETTYADATIRDQKFVEMLRQLVALFLRDLDAYNLRKDLFTQAEKEWNFISLFRKPPLGEGIIHPRFDEMRSLVQALHVASGADIEHVPVFYPKRSDAHSTPAIIDTFVTNTTAVMAPIHARGSSSGSKRDYERDTMKIVDEQSPGCAFDNTWRVLFERTSPILPILKKNILCYGRRIKQTFVER